MRTLITSALMLAAALPLATVSMPAAAQRGTGVVMDVFGNDRCPASNGEEIVVCRRFPEAERYRIPKDLRDAAKDAPPESWTNRALNMEYVGRGGTNSCSATGAGGWTGCQARLMQQAKAERKEAKSEEPVLP